MIADTSFLIDIMKSDNEAIKKAEETEKMRMIADLSTLSLVDFTSTIIQSSINLLSIYGPTGLGSRDCVILATMKSVGSKTLLTHDQSFKKVKEIKVIDEIR